MNAPARSGISVAARLESLAAIRAFVEEACRRAGAAPSDAFDLKLAVDEACTNVIEHGYRGRLDGTIALECEAGADAIRVTIVDRGRPFAPGEVAEPDLEADWQSRRIGGLGWHLIRKSVDEIHYAPDASGGNRLTLVKRSR